jgi:hypothetical protein
MKDKQIPLVVTTSHKGVFFGYAKPTANTIVRLERARMCVYWSADMKGVVGLAATGPSKDCKIGPAAPAITLHGVTLIMEVSPEAEALWNQQPWG